MLTVPGRKSGIPRSTPLLCVPHEDGWLVAGSNWGAPKPPAWVGNLDAADRATVTFRGRPTAVTPRRVEGAERAAYWQVMLETWPNYAKYAERTDREIPVFLLRPADRASLRTRAESPVRDGRAASRAGSTRDWSASTRRRTSRGVAG